jgi:hypothetical protein
LLENNDPIRVLELPYSTFAQRGMVPGATEPQVRVNLPNLERVAHVPRTSSCFCILGRQPEFGRQDFGHTLVLEQSDGLAETLQGGGEDLLQLLSDTT